MGALWLVLAAFVVVTLGAPDDALDVTDEPTDIAHNNSEFRVFVVNLKRRPERRRFMEGSLPPLWRSLTTFTTDWDGPFDGHNLTWASLRTHGVQLFDWELPDSANDWWGRPMTSGEVGCALSHIAVWRRAQQLFAREPRVRAVVVLEDDVVFAADTAARWSDALALLDSAHTAWELLYLGRAPQTAEPPPVRPFVRPAFSYNTHAYALTAGGVRKLLALRPERALVPADDFLCASFGAHPRADVAAAFAPCVVALAMWPDVAQQSPVAGKTESDTASGAHLTALRSVTVSAPDTSRARVLLRSLARHGHRAVALGGGVPWRGGDMRAPGGGHKIALVRDWLRDVADDEIVLFSDGHDSFVTGSPSEFVRRFRQCDCDVLFGAEAANWPGNNTQQLETATRYRYLNSGGYIGRASVLREMFATPLRDDDDDQLYCQTLYTSRRWRIALDAHKNVFCPLGDHVGAGAVPVTMHSDTHFTVGDTQRHPLQLHGCGPGRALWHHFVQRRAGLPDYTDRNRSSVAAPVTLPALSCDQSAPLIVMATVAATQHSDALHSLLASLRALSYASRVATVVVHAPAHPLVTAELRDQYAEFVFVAAPRALPLQQTAWERWLRMGDGAAWPLLLLLGEETRLAPHAAAHLVCALRRRPAVRVLAPVLRERDGPPDRTRFAMWANVWTAIDDHVSGAFAYSRDYADLIEGRLAGVFGVAHAMSALLIAPDLLAHLPRALWQDVFVPLVPGELAEVHFGRHLRERAATIPYADTTAGLGHVGETLLFMIAGMALMRGAEFDVADAADRVPVTLFDYDTRKQDWDAAYLSGDYQLYGPAQLPVEQPCPEVFRFPLFSARFCRELVALTERYGGWSRGQREYDPRIGSIEDVPTQDVHLKQVGLADMWRGVLLDRVAPVVARLFDNYRTREPHITFVVRYAIGGQTSLRAHHDASVYTVNVALNQHGVDYEGGGCQFVRSGCALTAAPVGSAAIHPGRLGTRYILVAFVE